MGTDIPLQVRVANELAVRFAAVDAKRIFSPFAKTAIRRADGTPFLEPYIPSLVECRHSVDIQPWSDGILPALVRTWHLSQGRQNHDVRATTAVSNYYKFSLATPDGKRDMHPEKLGGDRAKQYASLTLDAYVRHELELLAPSLVITFRGHRAAALRAHVGARCMVVEVNDPSWIKKGMGGVAKAGGSWRREVDVDARRLAPHEPAIAEALDACHSTYGNGKRDAARIYLMRYLSRWSRAPASPGATA